MEFHISRVVYRGYNNANANGGVSNANANNDASNSNANIGSRLDNSIISAYNTRNGFPAVVPNGTSLTKSSPHRLECEKSSVGQSLVGQQ